MGEGPDADGAGLGSPGVLGVGVVAISVGVGDRKSVV